MSSQESVPRTQQLLAARKLSQMATLRMQSFTSTKRLKLGKKEESVPIPPFLISGSREMQVELNSADNILQTAEVLKKQVAEMAQANQDKVQNLKENLKKKSEELEKVNAEKQKMEKNLMTVAQILKHECGQEIDKDEIPEKVEFLLRKLKNKDEVIKNAKRALANSSEIEIVEIS